MILHVSPDAPLLIRDATTVILWAHIGGAAVGLVSGGAAMVFSKGGSLHRAAGNVFFVAMLTMSGVGAAVAPFLPTDQAPNTFAGVFLFYLTATGWAAAKRAPGETGRFELAAFFIAAGAVVGGLAWVWIDAHTVHPAHGFGEGAVTAFAAMIGLAAALDLRVILRGGISGAPRLTRHLWRMSAALMFAAGSFAGQPKAVPEFLRGSPILLLPMLAVFVALIYWLVRVRSAKAFRARASGSGPPVRPARDLARGAA
jgi:hypothetical protein